MGKRNVLMVHGSYGNPEENWFPWLKSELEKTGCSVFVPRFPTPGGQTLDSWMKVFGGYEKYLGKETLVVGHSLGVPFLLSVLERKPAKAAFFVGGFASLLGNRFDEVNKTFVQKDFDWKSIRKNCRKFYIFHSENDPYVPLEKAEEVAKNLGTEIILVKNAGHFNEKAGYTKFKLLLDEMMREIA